MGTGEQTYYSQMTVSALDDPPNYPENCLKFAGTWDREAGALQFTLPENDSSDPMFVRFYWFHLALPSRNGVYGGTSIAFEIAPEPSDLQDAILFAYGIWMGFYSSSAEPTCDMFK